MKKLLLLTVLFMFSAVLFTACDNDDGNSYKFKGTVELSHSPVSGDGTLSIAKLKSDNGDKIMFTATVKNSKGELIKDAAVSWGTTGFPIGEGYVSYPLPGRMVLFDVGDVYQAGDIISVKASYIGVTSSEKTITFTP